MEVKILGNVEEEAEEEAEESEDKGYYSGGTKTKNINYKPYNLYIM